MLTLGVPGQGDKETQAPISVGDVFLWLPIQEGRTDPWMRAKVHLGMQNWGALIKASQQQLGVAPACLLVFVRTIQIL